jgi:hypothetical protein
MDVDLAAAFEQETGCALHAREILGMTMLVPEDDRFGAFGLVFGDAPQVVFRVKSYGRVHLVVWRADEKKLDKALRKISDLVQ